MKKLSTKNIFVFVFCLLTVTYVITTYSTIKARKRMLTTADANGHVDGQRPVSQQQNQTVQQASTTIPDALHISFIVNRRHSNAYADVALQGILDVNTTQAEVAYWNDVDSAAPANSSNSSFLGNYTLISKTNWGNVAVFHGPTNSTRVQRIAIIIPFRDREQHLRFFIGHLLPVLRRQGNTFSVFVAEQLGNGTFNKGRLMNSGFKYALHAGNKTKSLFDCFIFHDVDLLMENDNLIYRCSKGDSVDHLSTAINKFDYKPVCCGMTVGGALGFTSDQFKKVNGFPNSFWGWGGEDDAINDRIKKKGLAINRPSPGIGRYTMIKHESDKLNPYNNNVWKDLKVSLKNSDDDGLSSLSTTVHAVEKYKTYVKVIVDVGSPS